MNFYSCVADNGTLPTKGPVTCALDGKTYAFNTVFTTADITNYDKAPSAARPLILSVAEKNFNVCAAAAANGTTDGAYPNVVVYLVNSSFIDTDV
jgi:hypothetical protein